MISDVMIQVTPQYRLRLVNSYIMATQLLGKSTDAYALWEQTTTYERRLTDFSEQRLIRFEQTVKALASL